ncbi:hypothetical protein GCM10022251_73920 [Phytohabitans flavus]
MLAGYPREQVLARCFHRLPLASRLPFGPTPAEHIILLFQRTHPRPHSDPPGVNAQMLHAPTHDRKRDHLG